MNVEMIVKMNVELIGGGAAGSSGASCEGCGSGGGFWPSNPC
jgi:hypothetical protein